MRVDYAPHLQSSSAALLRVWLLGSEKNHISTLPAHRMASKVVSYQLPGLLPMKRSGGQGMAIIDYIFPWQTWIKTTCGCLISY